LTLPDGIDLLSLARRFEPVVRYTAGELFFPMPVEAYVSRSALWETQPATGDAARLVLDHGTLDIDRLCAHARANPDTRMELRYAPRPMSRAELRAWRRDPQRPRLGATSRFVTVGLVGRLVDALVRLSLTMRGRVPGGLTAATHSLYRGSDAAGQFPYYAHVSFDGGYVVVQYWMFYAMNDWRSSFAGVNDHEADWEQVTVFLVPTDEVPTDEPESAAGPGGLGHLRASWVAFSSHDEVGADLRRRHDDPDLSWVDGTHPVVNAGAGSHSGAYLPGDYLVRVRPRSFQRWFDAIARVRELLFPWTRGSPRAGLGIPYVDYKRGDGIDVGPGTDRPWTPVLIDSSTPWVRDYRGLWGLDTDDPFGGERAPAGPMYERRGAIRESWADPVAWAGLDTVPPTPAEAAKVEAERRDELDHRRDELDREIAAQQYLTRRLVSGLSHDAVSTKRANAAAADVSAEARRLDDLRATRRAVVGQRDRLVDSINQSQTVPPHAHLHRRVVPIRTAGGAKPGLLLRFWTEASISVLLALFGLALLFNVARPGIILAAIVGVMAVEAALRRRLRYLLYGIAIVTVIVVGVVFFVTEWRFSLGMAALVASVALAAANIRATIARR
jgi:hypothetical protein